MNNSGERGEHANNIDHGVAAKLLTVLLDGCPVVRKVGPIFQLSASLFSIYFVSVITFSLYFLHKLNTIFSIAASSSIE